MITFVGLGKSRMRAGTPLTAVVICEYVRGAAESLEIPGEITLVFRESQTADTRYFSLPFLQRTNRERYCFEFYSALINTENLQPGAYEIEARHEKFEPFHMSECVWILTDSQYRDLIVEELDFAKEDISDGNDLRSVVKGELDMVLGDIRRLDTLESAFAECSFSITSLRLVSHIPMNLLASTVRALAFECRQVALLGGSQRWSFELTSRGCKIAYAMILTSPLSPMLAASFHDSALNEALLIGALNSHIGEIAVEAQGGEPICGMSISLQLASSASYDPRAEESAE
jgi:hypothetical protein